MNARYVPLAGRIPGFPAPDQTVAPDPTPEHGTPPQHGTTAGRLKAQASPATGTPRHCWVIDAPEAPGRWPGVLLGWEQDARGWIGRVVMGVAGSEGMVTMTLWVRAEHLRPVDTA